MATLWGLLAWSGDTSSLFIYVIKSTTFTVKVNNLVICRPCKMCNAPFWIMNTYHILCILIQLFVCYPQGAILKLQ